MFFRKAESRYNVLQHIVSLIISYIDIVYGIYRSWEKAILWIVHRNGIRKAESRSNVLQYIVTLIISYNDIVYGIYRSWEKAVLWIVHKNGIRKAESRSTVLQHIVSLIIFYNDTVYGIYRSWEKAILWIVHRNGIRKAESRSNVSHYIVPMIFRCLVESCYADTTLTFVCGGAHVSPWSRAVPLASAAVSAMSCGCCSLVLPYFCAGRLIYRHMATVSIILRAVMGLCFSFGGVYVMNVWWGRSGCFLSSV